MAANYDYEDGPAANNEEVELQSGGEIGYDPQYVPDSVKSFVVHMYRHIREKNVYEIHQMCETSFQSLSERLFKETPWPSVEAIAPYVDNDHVFCLLYREMWFRHLYARLSPTLKQRIDSYDNYCSLFQVVLHGVVNMQLPNQWLWDMVDEFVYQFQSFCQFRAKLKNKTEQELALLKQHDKAWNVYGVLNFLQALVEKSSIIQILEQDKQGLEQFTATDGYDYSGGSNVLKVLGYFSMVGLLRVHCLLGDYHTALKWLQPIDISQQGVYTSVIGCHIATIYHYGFANLMLRRYVDAVREFNKILLYIYKTKQYHQKSPQYEQILKKNEQMYALLVVCLSLCPQTKLVDESVSSQLREKYGDKMMRMQRYDDEAFGIYDELFSYACPKFITPSVVLHGVVNMQLPNQWLWDMVDEFVYQFQSFCQFRAKLKNKTEQELALLKQHDKAWNVYGVLNFLQALVEKSSIIQILEQDKQGLEQFTATDGYDYSGGSNVLKVLGYFSMVGLLRVHCLLGDYHTALKWLQPIDISQQGVYTSVIGCHIATIYHYGFANLMLRRYVDAVREFNKILLYIYKTKQYHQKSPQYEQILKKNEQMYALLVVCLSLCPQTKLVDESVSSQLREKYGDKMMRMQRYDDEAFGIYDELFSYACPKFITPSAPSFEEPLVNYNQDAYRLQLKMFLYEVKQQQLLSGIRTFLKVYSSISLAKLANYMEVDEPTLRTILLTYKHKTHSVDSDGRIISNADIDFHIKNDMIYVVESKPAKHYGDFFLRQIAKLEGVINDMDRIKLE